MENLRDAPKTRGSRRVVPGSFDGQAFGIWFFKLALVKSLLGADPDSDPS